MTGGLAQLGERYNGIVEVIGSSPLSSIRLRRIESREEKVESRKIRDLEIFSGLESFITAPLSPPLLGLLSTHYFLCSASRLQTWRIEMAFAFEKLLVYQKSVDFADAVCDLTEQFPARYNHLADQVNRASLSIASNIAEGNGRFTKPDRKHFFGIARGSVQECVPQLELARRRKLVSDELHAKLKEQLEEISRMLSGLINGLDNREN